MRNKKTIALAMAAATVAPMAVPAFAAEKAAIQTPAAEGRFGLDHLNNRRVDRVSKDDLAETMRRLEAQGRSPKVVYRQKDSKGEFQDALVQYNYNWVNEDSSVNADLMATWKAQYNAAKSFVEYAYSDKAVDASTGAKLYNVTVTERSYSIDLNTAGDAGVTRNAKIVKVTENLADINGNGTRDTYTYVFDGLDTTFKGEEVVLKDIVLDFEAAIAKDEVAVEAEYKKLNAALYNLNQAVKNHKLVVTTNDEKRGKLTYRVVNIYRKDAVTKVGEILVRGVNKIDNTKVKHVSINNDFKGHWAEQTILNAMLNGVVSTESTYRPKENITRAEFASVIYNTLKLQGKVLKTGAISHHAQGNKNQNIHFSDVSKGSWYATPIMELAKAGYLNGNPDGTFKPNAPITRQEAAKIMADVVFYGGKETFKTDANGKKINVDIITSFKDDSTIASWADESVQALVNTNIDKKQNINETISGPVISGDAGKNTFRGKDSISRAEALIMAERAGLAGFQKK